MQLLINNNNYTNSNNLYTKIFKKKKQCKNVQNICPPKQCFELETPVYIPCLRTSPDWTPYLPFSRQIVAYILLRGLIYLCTKFHRHRIYGLGMHKGQRSKQFLSHI